MRKINSIKITTALFWLIILLLPNTRVYANDKVPSFVETGGYIFDVVTSGEVPTNEFTVLQFVENVYVAHNTLAGKHFSNTAKIQYSDGTIRSYEVVETIVLQAIDPYDPATKYTDGTYVYTSDDIHYRIFSRGIVFATCYDKNGQVGWGRKFIIMKEQDKILPQ